MDGLAVAFATKDNPFNPFTDYDDWRNFDASPRFIPELGMKVATFCREYQAREAITSTELTDEENNVIISNAIDDIIRLDPWHIYIKVYEPEKAVQNGY